MTEEASDVVIVGSGAAGMMAALRSILGGAKVTVLEVADQFGGTSAWSGGGMWLPLSRLAKEAGVKDSPELVKEYLTYLTHDVTDPKVIDAFIETAPKILDFLEDNTALTFYVDLERPDYSTSFPGALDYGRLFAPNLYELSRLPDDLRAKLRQPDWEARVKGNKGNGGMEAVSQKEIGEFELAGNPTGWIEVARERVAKGIITRGCALIASMLEVVNEKGARLITNARARELVIEDGRVTGVIAEIDGELKTFPATTGVVLAGGGFEWNEELWDGLVRVPGIKPLSPPFNRGDNLKLAQQAGARLALLDQVWWSVNAGGQPGQLTVDRSGKRFMNENITYNDYGKVLGYFDPHTYTFPHIPTYVISNRPLLLSDTDVNNLGAQVGNVDDAEAPTLRELAEKIGVDADQLEKTVVEFDKHAIEGKDPAFHRGEAAWDRWRKFDKTLKNPALAPIDNGGPYYAQRIQPRCFGTKGGGVINEHGQIIDFDNNPIPGLYGAGNGIASPFGLSYPGGGGTLAPAVTFGYLAGEHIVASLPVGAAK